MSEIIRPPAGAGVVAVSGGADSVALLHWLRAAGAGPLTVAHFDHQLRGDSASDADFVRILAAGLGLDFRAGTADVRAAAAGEGVEGTARRLRYAFLAEVARNVNAGWVATGHTLNDQAETVLMRLCRGAGLRGLRGILPDRELAPGVRLIRPRLGFTREQGVEYLRTLGQTYRDDPSNADATFLRNRVRHGLLADLGGRPVEAIARVAAEAAEAFAFLEIEAAKLLAAAELPRAGAVLVFTAAVIRAAPPVLAREAFRLAWRREAWPEADVDSTHWRRLASLTPGDFPGRVRLRVAGRVVQLGPRE